MGDAETFAADRLQVVAFQFGARREGHGVDDDIQVVPVVVQVVEYGIDFLIVGDIAGYGNFRPAFAGHLFDPVAQLVILVGESQFGTFALHGLGDAPGDGTVAGESDDECAFAA